jgi:cytochrome c biogenesis protein CcmG/thiol:disulfide interchange protein DsbE
MPGPMKDYGRLALLVIVVVLAAFGYVHLQQNKGYGLKVGTPAPAFTLPVRGGGSVDLASLRGHVVVVNFWATWCPPCVAEMPSLDRLHRALSRDGLVVLAVSADEDEAALTTFLEKGGLALKVLRDPGGAVAQGQYRTTGYPETFVIDAAGVIRETYVGPADWDTPDALDHFRSLLRPADR